MLLYNSLSQSLLISYPKWLYSKLPLHSTLTANHAATSDTLLHSQQWAECICSHSSWIWLLKSPAQCTLITAKNSSTNASVADNYAPSIFRRQQQKRGREGRVCKCGGEKNTPSRMWCTLLLIIFMTQVCVRVCMLIAGKQGTTVTAIQHNDRAVCVCRLM